ncbi:TPA: protein-L-isoaspartate O-methyltransferase, partial [Neisseria gonorrhoeae]
MDFEKARFNMVEQQIRPWDVLDFDVLDALEEIPRELFADESLQGLAYADMELPLANGHKMLEPKIVARLAQGLKLTKNDTVLEIGTGSGYATALLAKLAG